MHHWNVLLFTTHFRTIPGINTNLRRIDLICKLVAPVFITMIMHFAGLLVATVVLAGWNMVSFVVETLLINIVYKMEPNLATKEYRHKEISVENNTNNSNNNESIELSEVSADYTEQVCPTLSVQLYSYKFSNFQIS